jgi:CheY-like chemotaxis protein
VRDAAHLTAPRWRDDAQAAGRAVSLHIEGECHPIVAGSPARLREVMTNLIFNAVDALPSGGTIRIRVSSEENQAIVEITDSGVGMSAEVQARVFEPFFTTKGESGTGLGLAMVFGVVERYDGQISVKSASGEGTTIRISLPMIDPLIVPTESAAPVVVTSWPTTALRVLTVDDEPAMTKAVVRMLRPGGHTVVTAASGEEALEKLSAEPFDVVLSDMGMGPGMNGWELVAVVKARWPEVRFFLATGWGAAIDPDEARAKGVEAVLAKPYRPADLDRVLAA